MSNNGSMDQIKSETDGKENRKKKEEERDTVLIRTLFKLNGWIAVWFIKRFDSLRADQAQIYNAATRGTNDKF